MEEKAIDNKITNDISREPITSVVVACDESGAKGYADNDENFPGEVGVFAGIMIDADHLSSVLPDFDALVARFAPVGGKLHITDLSPENQESLRIEVYALIRKHELPCFYEAVHVAGFHAMHQNLESLLASAHAGKQSPIKMSGNKPKPSSLHVALFQGLYGKVIAFCMERNRRRLCIDVRTDKVDAPIVKHFIKDASALTEYGVKIKTVTGFDPVSKQRVSGTITVAEAPAEARLPVIVENLKLNVIEGNDGLVIAADVLANSLTYLFHNRSSGEQFRALNTREAFAQHPLQDCLDSFYRWDGYNFTDTVYRHPRDPQKS